MHRALSVYRRLFGRFGPQHWWPSRTGGALEVCVGAILTQNTAWTNVEKALDALIAAGGLDLAALAGMPRERLAALIRPSGYFNQKAARLQAFAAHMLERHGGLERMFDQDTTALRAELLSLSGVGPETADSMLLYAAGRPVFVVDAYTRRIAGRLGLCPPAATYDELQAWFTAAVPSDARVYNEYHALLVRLAKEHCAKTAPACGGCPLQRGCAKT